MKVILIVTLFLWIPSFVAAQVIINEIAWMGTPIESVEQNNWWRYEWVELYNASDSSIVLDGWSLELSRDDPDFSISLKGTVGSKGYFLIGASDKIFNSDVNYANLSGKFVNSGQRVILKDSKGMVIEEIDARNGWFGGDNSSKQSMERWNPLTSANDPENWRTSLEIGGTPKAENSIFGKEKSEFEKKGIDAAVQEQLKNSLGGPSTDIINRTTGVAFLIALLSALLILLLKRHLRSAEE